MDFIIQGPSLGKAVDCEVILRSLPEWFGIEEAVNQLARDIETHPTFIAVMDALVVGFLTLKHHSEYATEILVMGVKRDLHRNGIGRALVESAETYLRTQNIEYLQVKTLSSSHPDEDYARTRQFYTAMGFRPLEELSTLWGEENPCLLMIKGLT